MIPITALWLPIILSAVLVFIASAIIHMVLPYHRSDFRRLPNEEKMLDALGAEELPPGNYTFELECGPEYRIREGEFLIRSGATDQRAIKMSRFVDMKKEGWWSGELHVHRPLKDIPLLILTAQIPA